MRRRFGRRRQRDRADDGRSPIDVSWLERIVSAGLAPVETLEPLAVDEIPDTVCRLGAGDLSSGGRCVVAFSPTSAAEALLGLVAALDRLPVPANGGEALAIAPSWDAADRRLLGSLGATPLPIRALAAPGLGGAPLVAPESARSLPEAPARAAAALPSAAERLVFARALAALEGLAAKHCGTVRASGGLVELVLLARRVAVLRPSSQGLVLEIQEPSRAQHGLSEDNLAEVLDRLEGSIRKCLNDRHLRDSAGGQRARLAPHLAHAAGLGWWRLWPAGADELECIDVVGAEADGTPVLGVAGSRLDLPALARALRASIVAEPLIGELLGAGSGEVRLARPKLRIAAAEIDSSVDSVLACLRGDVACFDVAQSMAATPALSERAAPLARRGAQTGTAPAAAPSRRPTSSAEVAARPAAPAHEETGRRRPAPPPSSGRTEEPAQGRGASEEQGDDGEPGAGEREDSEDGARRDGGRRRRRGRGRRSRPAEPDEAASGVEEAVEESVPTRPKFLELSAFDLDDQPSGEENGDEGRRGGRRRRRGRGRGRRDEAGAAADDEPEPEAESDVDPDLDLDGDEVLRLAEAPEPADSETPIYDEDDLEEEPLSASDRLRLERERRRRARIAKAAPLTDQPKEEEGADEIEPAPLPRGRAAILARADRDSVFSALLLAREMRSIEGIWVYPQEELMRFFRGVATDLRSGSPIYVVGFEPRPAHDVIQAASLYSDRLAWFDHHEWPPEDLHAMRGAIGQGMVHLAAGAGSSLPAVLSLSTRRSRFSDKLVDLATGRFTQHDWDRWGRLWWHRVGEVASRHGEHRSDLDALLAGRPSDLTKEAARIPVPPLPAEAEFVASRDFRLVHFGGHGLVVAEIPEELDVGLSARILRERYAASLSLARHEGSNTCLLGADDSRRAIDVEAMAEHLATKYGWVEPLPDADHVARIQIRDLDSHEERIEEVVSEIAMGRSILEG